MALGSTAVEDDAVGGGTTIKVTPLSTKRIFQEFNVNADNYVLLLVSSSLVLSPKSAGSALPVLSVMQFSPSAFSIHKTKPNVTRGTGTVLGAPSANIFNSIAGTYSFTTTVAANGSSKTVFTVLAAGATHSGSQANKSLLMSLKLTTGKSFVPQ
ncbi:MAG: hypothetical protein WCF18_19450 [Chthoniobacteraceae bacterium]